MPHRAERAAAESLSLRLLSARKRAERYDAPSGCCLLLWPRRLCRAEPRQHRGSGCIAHEHEPPSAIEHQQGHNTSECEQHPPPLSFSRSALAGSAPLPPVSACNAGTNATNGSLITRAEPHRRIRTHSLLTHDSLTMGCCRNRFSRASTSPAPVRLMDRRLPSYRQARTTPYARPDGAAAIKHESAPRSFAQTTDRLTPAGAPAAPSNASSYAPLLPMSAATAVAQRVVKVKQESSASSKRRGDDDDDGEEEEESTHGAVPETDPRRLEQRQKQIDRGKATAEYKLYLSRVPIETRVYQLRYESHPVTPNKTQGCSKRSWDGQVRKWRRLLHAFVDNVKKGEAVPASANATAPAASAQSQPQPVAPDAAMQDQAAPSLPQPVFAPSAPLQRKPAPIPSHHSLLHPTPLRGRSWADETDDEPAATEAAAAAPSWMPTSLAAAASARPTPSATLSLPLSAISSSAPRSAGSFNATSPIVASPFASNSAAAKAPDQLGSLFDEEALLAPVANSDSTAHVAEEELADYDDEDDEMRAQVLAEAMRQCER